MEIVSTLLTNELCCYHLTVNHEAKPKYTSPVLDNVIERASSTSPIQHLYKYAKPRSTKRHNKAFLARLELE